MSRLRRVKVDNGSIKASDLGEDVILKGDGEGGIQGYGYLSNDEAVSAKAGKTLKVGSPAWRARAERTAEAIKNGELDLKNIHDPAMYNYVQGKLGPGGEYTVREGDKDRVKVALGALSIPGTIIGAAEMSPWLLAHAGELIGGTIGGTLGDKATNALARLPQKQVGTDEFGRPIYESKYEGWGDMISSTNDKWHNAYQNNGLVKMATDMTNPGAWVGGAYGASQGNIAQDLFLARRAAAKGIATAEQKALIEANQGMLNSGPAPLRKPSGNIRSTNADYVSRTTADAIQEANSKIGSDFTKESLGLKVKGSKLGDAERGEAQRLLDEALERGEGIVRDGHINELNSTEEGLRLLGRTKGYGNDDIVAARAMSAGEFTAGASSKPDIYLGDASYAAGAQDKYLIKTGKTTQKDISTFPGYFLSEKNFDAAIERSGDLQRLIRRADEIAKDGNIALRAAIERGDEEEAARLLRQQVAINKFLPSSAQRFNLGAESGLGKTEWTEFAKNPDRVMDSRYLLEKMKGKLSKILDGKTLEEIAHGDAPIPEFGISSTMPSGARMVPMITKDNIIKAEFPEFIGALPTTSEAMDSYLVKLINSEWGKANPDLVQKIVQAASTSGNSVAYMDSINKIMQKAGIKFGSTAARDYTRGMGALPEYFANSSVIKSLSPSMSTGQFSGTGYHLKNGGVLKRVQKAFDGAKIKGNINKAKDIVGEVAHYIPQTSTAADVADIVQDITSKQSPAADIAGASGNLSFKKLFNLKDGLNFKDGLGLAGRVIGLADDLKNSYKIAKDIVTVPAEEYESQSSMSPLLDLQYLPAHAVGKAVTKIFPTLRKR